MQYLSIDNEIKQLVHQIIKAYSEKKKHKKKHQSIYIMHIYLKKQMHTKKKM